MAGPWYARGNLGPAVVEEIRAAYRLAERHGRYRIYLPAGADGAPVRPNPLASARPRPRP